MSGGNWQPIILFFVLLFIMGGVCLLAANLTDTDVLQYSTNLEITQTFSHVRGLPTGIVNTNLNGTSTVNGSSTVNLQNQFLGYTFPPGFNFSYINNSQINFIQSPSAQLTTKDNIFSRFYYSLGLLPDYILYPFIIIESALLIIGIIKLLPFEG